VCHWGRIGTNEQEMVEVFDSEIEAGKALEAIAQEKRRRGYRDL
jgi:predicted DNA-binding WGR domain protein